MQRSLQAEWLFLQRVTSPTTDLFTPLDESMTRGFIPSLLGDDSISPNHRALLALPVKRCGIALPSPSETADSSFITSTLCTAHATAAVQQGTEYVRQVHLKTMVAEKLRAEIQKDATHVQQQEKTLSECGKFERRTIQSSS